MIEVLVPSRGRPGSIARLLMAWHHTEAAARLHVLVDDDDPHLSTYRATWELQGGDGVGKLTVGPSSRIGPWLDRVAPLVEADVVGFMGDDHVPRTPWWDLAVQAQIGAPGDLRVVYGNDLFRGPELATACFLDAEIVRRLGYMVAPGCLHLYFDDFWMHLGRSLGGLTYLPDVIIEHLHPTAGKSEWDPGYELNNSGPTYDNDRRAYEAWLASGEETLARVRR